jgi:hypothetical protein
MNRLNKIFYKVLNLHIPYWLGKWDVDKYHLDKDRNLFIDQNLELGYKPLPKLPFTIYQVNGSVTAHCGLTSLEGFPRTITGDLQLSFNKLSSLKGGPLEVKGNVDVSNNQLVNLVGSPNTVNYFNCSNNPLVSLKGAPANPEKFYYQNSSSFIMAQNNGNISYLVSFLPIEFLKGIVDHDILEILKAQGDYSIWNSDNSLNLFRFKEMMKELKYDKEYKISNILKSIIDELNQL